MSFKDTNPGGFEGITIVFVTEDKTETIHIKPEKEQTYEEFLANKRKKVINYLSSLYKPFELQKFDYVIDGNKETLVIDDVKISCQGNSMYAIKEEILGYLIVRKYTRYLPEDLVQELFKRVKRSWEK